MGITRIGTMLNFSSQFKLVKFRDGKFGARKGWFVYEFLDLLDPKLYTWTGLNDKIKYCKGTEAQVKEAIKIYDNYKANKYDNGEIV
jgi:hypothetical protein